MPVRRRHLTKLRRGQAHDGPTSTGEEVSPDDYSSDDSLKKKEIGGAEQLPSLKIDLISGLLLILITGVSLFTRYYRISKPPEVVFDEVHFGGFTNDYIRGKYFFDIHPPLGKLILMGFVRFFAPEYTGDFSFEHIGNKYTGTDVPFVVMRLVPATFGALSCPIMFLIARQLRCSHWTATLAAAMLIFDGSVVVQSRLILIDAILLFFTVSTLFCSFGLQEYASRKNVFSRGYYVWIVACGISAGCCVSVKWTGLGTVGVVGIQHILVCLARVYRTGWTAESLRAFKDLVHRGVVMLAAALLVYLVLWYLHFVYLPLTGPGDAFMTPAFRATLKGSEYYGKRFRRPSFLSKVWELNRTMLSANAGITTRHPWESEWWSWPLCTRGIHNWQGAPVPNPNGGAPLVVRSYLLGNPAVYWGTSVLVVVSAALCVYIIWRRQYKTQQGWTYLSHAGLLLGLYIVNLLPYVMVERCTFLYHYFPALITAILLGARTVQELFGSSTLSMAVVAGWLSAVIALYLYFSPFVYALPLTNDAFEQRVWFPGWR